MADRQETTAGARDVVLETVGHVSMGDPDAHLLLGQLAVGLKDRTLLAEARAFLDYLEAGRWRKKLDDVDRTGNADFSDGFA